MTGAGGGVYVVGGADEGPRGDHFDTDQSKSSVPRANCCGALGVKAVADAMDAAMIVAESFMV